MDGLSRGKSSSEIGLTPGERLVLNPWMWDFLRACEASDEVESVEWLTGATRGFVELLRIPPSHPRRELESRRV
jgi:hypothetical protein